MRHNIMFITELEVILPAVQGYIAVFQIVLGDHWSVEYYLWSKNTQNYMFFLNAVHKSLKF